MYHTEPPTDKTTTCSFRSAQAATLLEFMYHSRIVLSVGGSMWYMIRNLRCTVKTDSVLANSKTQNAFLFAVNAIFRHDYPLAVEPGSTPRPLVQKKTWRDSLPIDMLLSAVSVLVVGQSSSEIPEELVNNPLYSGQSSARPLENGLVLGPEHEVVLILNRQTVFPRIH